MSKSYEILSSLLEKTMALQTSLVLFEWDNETLAPEGAGSYTSRVIGALSEEYYRVITGEEMGKAIADCEEDKACLMWSGPLSREQRKPEMSWCASRQRNTGIMPSS